MVRKASAFLSEHCDGVDWISCLIGCHQVHSVDTSQGFGYRVKLCMAVSFKEFLGRHVI